MNISEYYCPDCNISFKVNSEYKLHVTEKLICYRCLRQFKTEKGLSMHGNKKSKCSDKRRIFAESLQNKQRTKRIEEKTIETTENVEQLRKQIVDLQKQLAVQAAANYKTTRKLESYKIKGLEAISKHRNVNSSTALTIRSTPLMQNEGGRTGYTQEAWTRQIVGDNENDLLAAEFGSDAVNGLNEEIHQAENKDDDNEDFNELFRRQNHSTSAGWENDGEKITGGWNARKMADGRGGLNYTDADYDEENDDDFRQRRQGGLNIDVEFANRLQKSNLLIGDSNYNSGGGEDVNDDDDLIRITDEFTLQD